jgi:signal transduction histidine kinase/CheY-like chemotaxis protein
MSSGRPSILLVDDVLANLVALEALLSDLECDTVRASSGNEALRQLLRREFAVMLVDVQMPEMDGYEVARHARANPATREVPIIFVTAMHESEEHILRGYDTGAVDFLFKPINAYILRSKVQVFLELWASRRRLEDEIAAHKKTLAELETFNYSISHDLRATVMIERVAELIVPALADACVVTLDAAATPDGQGAVAAAHRDPERAALLRGLELRLPAPPALQPEVDPARLAAGAAAEEALRGLGVRSLMVVPLPARGRNLGTIALLSSDPARRGTPADLGLAEELGRRAALAIDNALLYAQAQEAIRLRDEFLSVASHELRTPLTSLQLRQQSLLRVLERDPELAHRRDVMEKLEMAVGKAARLGQLIESLLDVSRIAAGLLAVELEEMDLGAVVAEVAHDFDDAASSAGCPIELRLEPGVIGRWDRTRIEQIASNLIGNAVKFGEGNPIEVTVSRDGGFAVLSVRDRGIGVPAEQQRRIFDRFERAVPARNYGGLGLGLYITRRVVEAHGGSVSVSGDHGKGATFTVRLPLPS